MHVGNSAGTGARMTLLSKKARDTAKKIVKKTQYIELANDPNFYNEYMDALYIPNADTNKFLKTLTRLKLHNNNK